MVHPGGRPCIYDKIAEAKALDEWSKRDDALTLLSFCNQRNFSDDYLAVWEKECPEFSRALKQAKNRIGERRELKANKGEFNYGIYNRAAHIYDTTLRHGEREEKVFEYELKKQLIAYEMQLREQNGAVDDDT